MQDKKEEIRMKENEHSLGELWENMKHTNICETIISKGEETR
jgi:hypothetical protein